MKLRLQGQFLIYTVCSKALCLIPYSYLTVLFLEAHKNWMLPQRQQMQFALFLKIL